MNYEQAVKKLREAGQEHVLSYYEELSEEQKEMQLETMFIWNVEKVSLQVVGGIKIVLVTGRLIIQRNQQNVYG